MRLPEDEALRLITERGNALRVDPRWSGGNLGSLTVAERLVIVPAGAYRLDRAGAFESVIVAPGTMVDLTVTPPLVEPLGTGEKR